MASFEMDFTTLGRLPEIYRQSQQRATRERALGQLGQGAGPLDYAGTARALLAAGDTEGGLTLARLAEAATDRARQQQNADRSFGLQERQFGLQEQQAREAARGYELREVDDGSGGKKLVRIEKASGKAAAVPIEGDTSTPANPFAYGKQNEGQSKDSGYANRMFRAEGILRDPAVEAAALSMKDAFIGGIASKEGILGMLANKQLGPEYQKFDQAQRDFINATLRRESGAAIAESEFTNARKQYFPQPGDTPEKLAEKRRNRQDAIAGVAGGGGPAYKPPFTFGPNGEMVPTNNPVQGATPKPSAPKPQADAWKNKETITAARANPQATLAEAQRAIQGGADPNVVAQRLRAIGIDPAGLGVAPAASPTAGAIY
jgi:hypothetical protein